LAQSFGWAQHPVFQQAARTWSNAHAFPPQSPRRKAPKLNREVANALGAIAGAEAPKAKSEKSESGRGKIPLASLLDKRRLSKGT
jgi:hypothetical protein